MSEDWRRKSYYRTRVLIPVDECLESAFGDCLVCLTGGQLNLVRNLLLYAVRRSTFVSEYEPNTYLAPTTEEWDDLQTMVADLEGNLMDCEQFTKDLQEILDWVRQQGTLSDGPFTEDEQDAFPYDDVVGDDELTPAEEDACAIAQLWFEWGYQVITEQVLPATRWGFDYLVPAVAGFIALAIGGPPAAMGVYALAELIQELLEIFYRGAETNLVNWMDTNKEDIVCVLFGWLKVGGDASAIWEKVEAAVIDPAEDISFGDKLILHLFMGSWAGSNAQLAFDAETEWATSNVQAGYCDECGEVWDFEQVWTFPLCPQGWTYGPSTFADCIEDGWPAMRKSGSTEGYFRSPSFTGLCGQYWNIHFYIENRSRQADGLQCGSAVLQKREIEGGSWASTGQQVELYSAGDGVWTFADQTPYGHTGAPSGWEYRIWMRARIYNSTPLTQFVVRHVAVLANMAEPP